ncbi:IS200/IS605 family transposase [Bacteroidota bacterium]
MANTYSQIYIQIIFSVSRRYSIIPKSKKEELHKYITGIISNRNQKLLAINCMPDHTHILIGLKPNIALSDLVRDIKAASSGFINEKKWVKGRFSWQEGYGSFSYSHSQIDRIIKYINNQEMHHVKRSFKDEYMRFLKDFNIEFDNEYLFHWIDI